jgi:hypothetical protein
VGQPGDVLEPGLDRRVAGDVAPTVEGLAQHDVVDESGVDARAAHGLVHGAGPQFEGVDVDQRAPEGRPDRRARRRHDRRVRHGHPSPSRVLPVT